MEEQVERLVQKALAKYQTTPPDQRLLIAISGMPGSGKTTLARTITSRINDLSTSPPTAAAAATATATYIPMDGYHYPLSHLATLPSPSHALARRGAPFTFNAPALLTLIHALRTPLTPSTPTIHAPSFSHALKDPVADAIAIPPTARLVLLEGNYLSLNAPVWSEIAALMDELWFVEVEEEVAARRLVERHVESGVSASREEAWERVRGNDLVNGREIVEGRVAGVSEVVRSWEDEEWVVKDAVE